MARPRTALLALVLSLSGAGAQAEQVTRLSLADACHLALLRDADVDRAKRSSAIAELQVADARANYRPDASVSVSLNQSATGSAIRADNYSYSNAITGNFIGALTGNVSMPVDISGSIGRQVKAARIRSDIAELSYDQSKRDALIDVQIAYLTALQAQQTSMLDQAVVSSIERMKSEAAKKLPSIIPFLDVELGNARDMLQNSHAAEDQAQDALKLTLRLPLDLDLLLTSPLPSIDPNGVVTETQDSADRLDVQVAKRRVDAADLAVEQAKDLRRPSLRLGAHATQALSGRFINEAGRTTNRDYGLSISLNLPLLNYDAGRNANSVRASRLYAEQARADLETSKLSAELRVRQAEVTLMRAKKRLKQLPDAEAARKALANATAALFAAPPATAPALLAQVSNARRSWRAAEASVIDARAGALIAELRLAKAQGRPRQLAGNRFG